MAKTFEVKRLLSAEGTGYFYIIKRGTKGEKKTKLEVKKFDPVVRKHVMYKEAKIK